MMRLLFNKKFLTIFIPIFIVLFAIIGGITSYVYFNRKRQIVKNTIDNSANFLSQRRELICAQLTPALSDINFMAKQRSVANYLKNSSNKPQLIEDMQLFAQTNRGYDQVRFIDRKGMEKIRIKWENNKLVVVPDSLLRDKGHRNYFKKSLKLKAGEVYVSSIDLNVEHNKIEVPFQPVIRFSTPVYDYNEQLTGFIVLNQYLKNFFQYLQTTSGNSNNKNLMFLNNNGYWLFGPQNYSPFGFMFDSLKDQNFQAYFPETWKSISKKEQGYSNNNEGLFVFLHSKLDYHIDNGYSYLFKNVKSEALNNCVLVTPISIKNINELHDIRQLFRLALAGAVFIIFVISFIISRLRYNELKYIDEINNINSNLEQKIEERTRLLSEKNIALKNVNEELEAFTYSVSHDLRAPLRHVSGFSDLLVKNDQDSLSEKGIKYLGYIKKSIAEMNQLIEDLLKFSRIGRAQLSCTLCDMNLLVNEIIPQIEQDYLNHKIKWKVADLPKVQGDYFLLRHVWINLLSNAVKYSSKRPISSIEITFNESAEQVIFSVKDNGIGFDMKYSHKLFGTFQRLHSGNEYEGTGIGLAIVRRIIAKHGGKTWAEGQPGAGAAFYFSLPKKLTLNKNQYGN